MKRLHSPSFKHAKVLTLLTLFLVSGCASTQQYLLDRCNSHAYVHSVMSDYLTTRYHSNAAVRLAVVPFSVPANLASRNQEMPGLGNKLAWLTQASLVNHNVIPIVEVLNRQDWPAKKEEFYTGNFTAISIARDAGYDLVLVGNVLPLSNLDSMSVESKLIETESGVTLWFGRTTAKSHKRGMSRELSTLWLDTENPAMIDSSGLSQDLADCISREVLSEE